MGLNVCTFVGRLTRDPEMRKTPSGKSIAKFTIAVDKIGKNKEADFIDCIAWEKTGEFICAHFLKGNFIGVSGRIETRSYNDTKGIKRKIYEIVVENASFTESKNTEQPEGPQEGPPAEEFVEISTDEGDLPF